MPEQEPTIGVAQTDFTEEVWQGIAGAYFEAAHLLPPEKAADPSRWFYSSAEDVIDGYGEHRFGSVITPHSKLLVCRYNPEAIHFDFYENADQFEIKFAESEFGVTPESITQDFMQKTATFLSELGIAKRITHCIDIR